MKPAALRTLFAVSALFVAASHAVATILTLPAPAVRSRASVVAQADKLVRGFGASANQLTMHSRKLRAKYGRYNTAYEFSLPIVVRLGSAGSSQPAISPRRISGPESPDAVLDELRGPNCLAAFGFGQPEFSGGGDLVLEFDSSGSEAFSTAYQQLLQSVFNSAVSTMDLIFGMPAVGGTVHVANFDATIGDRNAVAGGYYLPDNGSGVPEIRFPVYNANETAAVNFIHCLLLAYLGPDSYGWDGFEEGLVRAVTMQIARSSADLPAGLDSSVIEEVLDNSYDVLGAYDWDNQRPLSGPTFIAPNLISLPLPVSGGSGPYLMRYMMAGSAWSKVLVEYPLFAASLNADVYASPSLGSNLPGLITAAQTILANQRPTNPTVEGQTFASWIQHQYVLDPTATQGNKVLVEATPVTTGLTTGDFGVFIFDATYFSTDASGNETLLSGTSYPIFWDSSFNRVETSAQDEQITFTASDGSVAPDFPDLFGGVNYCATVDVPVGDQLQRLFVPAGAIATATSTTPNDFYGTVQGVNILAGDRLRVDVLVGGTVIASAPVNNSAFGITIGTTAGYNGSSSLSLNVVRTRSGADTTLLTRVVNKNLGPLDVDLRVGAEGTFTYSNGLAGGFSLIGLPVDPFSSDATAVLGVSAGNLLLARYDSSHANYDLYPSLEPLTMGHAYFLNLPAPQASFSISGRFAPGISTAVPLNPGWNMISNPLQEIIQTTSVRVVHAADFPDAYADAVGTLIGTDFFYFQPGPPDPISGVPESGTFVQATEFDPGVGYFFRVLAPEGVSLEFDPDTALQASRSAEATNGWMMQVNATAGGVTSSSLIGQASNGSNTLKLTVDSDLPPALTGGLQSYSVNGANLFRDIRPLNTRQTYNIRIDGLAKGKAYLLNFALMSGRVRSFSVLDRATGKSRTMFPGATAAFTSPGTSANLTVVVTQ